MCTSYTTLKLCTCKATSTDKLQNYWAIYRRNKGKNLMLMGEIILPYEWAEPNYHSIYESLSKRVNENSVFDVPMAFKSGDVLELVFNNNNRKERIVYGFKYSKSAWITHEIDVFELAGKYDELHFGTIKK